MRGLNSVFRALMRCVRKLRDQGPDRTWWIKTLLAVGARVGLWFLATNLLHS